MKATVIALCIGSIGRLAAQEERHLSGNLVSTQENAIMQIQDNREAFEMEVKVYPNPSSGTVYFEGHDNTRVTVYSPEGTYVGTWTITNGASVAIPDLPKGSFYCTITDGEKQIVKRIVVL